MLILTRKNGEKIRIGKNITITVIQVRGDRVRLGVEAPKGVAVHRAEVFDEIAAGRGKKKGST